jgi:hypothetical protein
MAGVNLSGMTVEALMDLRERVDEMLLEHRGEIQKQIERLDRAIALVTGPRGKVPVSAMKGRKVPPKYRGPQRSEAFAGAGSSGAPIIAAIFVSPRSKGRGAGSGKLKIKQKFCRRWDIDEGLFRRQSGIDLIYERATVCECGPSLDFLEDD